MKLIVNKDRSVIPIGTWGTKNENDYEILEFEFPEELENYNKRIVYYLDDTKPWDAIVDNKAYITNAITSKENVKAYIWCTKENSERPADTDFRSQEFEMHFYENENADGIVPTPVQVDGFNTMLTAMNAKIDEVDALEQTIETAEAERQEAEATRVSNESTRESNESTRQENEQTRQTQEADRERRTDEAIGNIEDKTAEYNANAEAKTTAFNTNATQKTNDFNSNYTQKVNDFNTNASSKELAFNSNASSKTSAFNSNAETKTNAFNTNATNKTNAFNSNATEKTTTFDNNASTKTSEFNTNAESKTSTFNDNAIQKTTNFDNNASEKTDEFNTNAQNKIDEYDEHIVEYQAQIDELQEEVDELSENMPWDTTEQATEIQVTDAAKYSRNHLEVFGNTSQDSTTGKNLIPTQISLWKQGTIANGSNTTSTTRIRTADYYPIENDKDYYISIQGNDYCFLNIWLYNTDKSLAGQYFDISSSINGATNQTINIPSSQIPNVAYMRVVLRNKTNSSTITPNELETIKPQIEQGSTATDFEPYTGGVPSPSPDYPQDIHVVTGENAIGVQGKNLIDYSALNKYNRDLSGAPSVGSPLRYYNNSKALQFNVSVGNFVGKNIFFSFDFSYTNFRRFALDTNGNYIETFSNGGLIKENYSYIAILINSNVDIPTSTDIKFMAEQGSIATSYVPYYHADYPINLGSIELCKIGDYQDYLYKENGNWYLQKNTASAILPKPTTGTINTEGTYNYFRYKGEPSGVYPRNNVICSHFIGAYNVADMQTKAQDNNSVFWGSLTTFVRVDKFNTVEEYVNALSANDITIIGRARTPTTTQITDETLISQLDAIYNHLALVKGTNNITVTAEDLAPYMKLTYMQDIKSKLDNLDSRLALLE